MVIHGSPLQIEPIGSLYRAEQDCCFWSFPLPTAVAPTSCAHAFSDGTTSVQRQNLEWSTSGIVKDKMVLQTVSGQADDEEISEVHQMSCVAMGLPSISSVPNLSACTNLVRLCLHGNRLSSLEGLSSLAALRELVLSCNAVSALGQSLSALTNLRKLDLTSNALTTADGFGCLDSLQYLVSSIMFIRRAHSESDEECGAPAPHSILHVKRCLPRAAAGAQPYIQLEWPGGAAWH